MKTAILATAAMLSLGVGSSYADNGEDAGNVANTLFTTLPGVITTAPGQRPQRSGGREPAKWIQRSGRVVQCADHRSQDGAVKLRQSVGTAE